MMSEAQFFKLVQMLEAIRLTVRASFTTADLNDARGMGDIALETEEHALAAQVADHKATSVLEWAEERERGSSGRSTRVD